MDSITHIALGACIGEAFFGRGFGKKAMLWGALAQSAPDIDFLGSLWLRTDENLLAHRGFTHSIPFALLVAPVLALVAERVHRPVNIRYSKWVIFFLVEVMVHLFIDGFNNYGVGWLEPFSHYRFSFNAIYVADPLFSIWAGIAVVMLFRLHSYHPRRRYWWRFGTLLPFLYLSWCVFNKLTINRDVKDILQEQHISYTRYFSTPAPLTNLLWYVVAGNDSGYHVGFRSIFDDKKQINFSWFPRNDSLLKAVANHEEVQHLIRFSQQFYTVEQWGDTLVFNDLRFGQMMGWQNPRGKFVFHYLLNHPADKTLVVQRGRFSGWDENVISGYLRRIRGD
ncbi:MAG: metal-dependent hydrolase [Chitinophagaceae bacterium]|nr:metal-dependent hydrolase [Chitinophagaceae bacterium]